MKKQPELTAQTRQNLIDAFWELFSTRGIQKITVREITLKAGYNRGTFYEYFTDVYDVLAQIEDSLLPTKTELPPVDLTGFDFEKMPIDSFIKMYEMNKKYYVVLFGDKGDPAFQERIKRCMKPLIMQMLGEQHIADPFDMEYILEYMLSAMIGVLSYWFRHQDSAPDTKQLDLMYDLMGNGVMRRLMKTELTN